MSAKKQEMKGHLTKHFEEQHSSGKRQRDPVMEDKVLHWIMHIAGEQPHSDFEHFIRDGTVLSKVMHQIVFNSVPVENIDENWGSNPQVERVNNLIFELRRYGIPDEELFTATDLLSMHNIPKVTKCLLHLSELAEADKGNLLHAK